jgi:O-acetyl-ADP-ribose deacetylase (regulator of RNase III)
LVGDLTQQKVDAVVNAANSTLLGGGGVDGAIHDAGGPAILEACREIRRSTFPKGLPTGESVITTGGNLPAKYVIHTVGPIFGRNPELQKEQLAACYTNSLSLAVKNSLVTVAFPSISTGAFGYPKPEAANVSSSAIRSFILQNPSILEVRLVFFLQRDARVFLEYQKF